MTPYPDDSAASGNDAQNAGNAAPVRRGSGDSANGTAGRVLEAEVLGPEDGSPRGPQGGYTGGRSDGPYGPGGQASGGQGRQGFQGVYFRTFRTGGFGGGSGHGGNGGHGGYGAPGFGGGFERIRTITGGDGNACLAPCITLALFLVCLSQFGLLAAIGFLVFHTIGGIAGSLRSMRLLMAGRLVNPWAWRLGNWFVSFMLTLWLAGGLD